MGQFFEKRPNFLIFFTYFFEADSNFASQTSIISIRFTHGKRQNGGFQEAEPQKDFAYTVEEKVFEKNCLVWECVYQCIRFGL